MFYSWTYWYYSDEPQCGWYFCRIYIFLCSGCQCTHIEKFRQGDYPTFVYLPTGMGVIWPGFFILRRLLVQKIVYLLPMASHMYPLWSDWDSGELIEDAILVDPSPRLLLLLLYSHKLWLLLLQGIPSWCHFWFLTQRLVQHWFSGGTALVALFYSAPLISFLVILFYVYFNIFHDDPLESPEVSPRILLTVSLHWYFWILVGPVLSCSTLCDFVVLECVSIVSLF